MGYMVPGPSSEPTPPTPAPLDEFLLPAAAVRDMVLRTDMGEQNGPFMLDADAGKKFYADHTVGRKTGPALVGHFALPCAMEGVTPFDVETPAIIEQESAGWWMDMWRKVRRQPPVVRIRIWSAPEADPLY